MSSVDNGCRADKTRRSLAVKCAGRTILHHRGRFATECSLGKKKKGIMRMKDHWSLLFLALAPARQGLRFRRLHPVGSGESFEQDQSDSDVCRETRRGEGGLTFCGNLGPSVPTAWTLGHRRPSATPGYPSVPDEVGRPTTRRLDVGESSDRVGREGAERVEAERGQVAVVFDVGDLRHDGPLLG